LIIFYTNYFLNVWGHWAPIRTCHWIFLKAALCNVGPFSS